MINKLEQRFWEVAKSLNSKGDILESTKNNLFGMKEHSQRTYLHEIRVALIALELAKLEGHKDLRPEFFGGANHDVGKLSVSKEILSDNKISVEDYEKIKNHAVSGSKILKDYYFSSLIAGLHHRHQEGGYGLAKEEIEKTGLPLQTKKRLEDAVINVALADYYDAAMTRKNSFREQNSELPKERMQRLYSDYVDRIEQLFESKEIAGIVGPFSEEIIDNGAQIC